MRNDKRNTDRSPRIPRTFASVTGAVVATLGATRMIMSDIHLTTSTFERASAGEVFADIPLPEPSMTAALSDAIAPTTPAGITFGSVFVENVPAEILDRFTFAQTASLILDLLLAALVLLAALGVLVGRLRWITLSRITVTGGVVLALGNRLTEGFHKTSAEDLAMWLLPADTWTEPGFVAGTDFVPFVAGLVIIALGWALRASARLARDADGVV